MEEKEKKKVKKKIKKNKSKPKIKKRKQLNIFKVNGKFNLVLLLINIIIPLCSGLLVGYLNRNTMNVYNGLSKFILNPPPIVFEIVWPILYILMGIAAYRIYMKNKLGAKENNAYFYYLVQLVVNLIWPFIFFTFRLYGVSFVLIIILLVLVIITLIKFFKVDKSAAALMVPYALWLVFATVLNFFIYILNEM